MTLEVRRAREDELTAAGDVTAAAYVDDGFVTEGFYLELLRDAAGRTTLADVVVAVDDGEVLGSVTLVGPDAPPEWRENYRDDTGTVRMLGVAKSSLSSRSRRCSPRTASTRPSGSSATPPSTSPSRAA